MNYEFTDKKGGFQMKNPEKLSYLYLPLANEGGILGSITPDGHGDSKLNQEQFLLEPSVVENLMESMVSRNFWCLIDGRLPWSATGFSAGQLAGRQMGETEESVLRAGLLYQETSRVNKTFGLEAKVLNFCPAGQEKAEVMRVTLTNKGENPLRIRPVSAVPIYGRGADHIRDHRHVTALLNRIAVTEDGVEMKPTMAFDERGHHKNEAFYGVYARDDHGARPVGAYPTVEAFVGEGGNLLCPKAIFDASSHTPSEVRDASSRAASAVQDASSHAPSEVRDASSRAASAVQDASSHTPSEVRDASSHAASAAQDASSHAPSKVQDTPSQAASIALGTETALGLSLPGDLFAGYEAMGALAFQERVLKPGEAAVYLVVLSYNGEGKQYLDSEAVEKALTATGDYWEDQKVLSLSTGDPNFDNWMEWISVQPSFRKLYGCSFLPYHDYGRGGRGWRDLWQDCLALLLRNPSGVREELHSFFAGIRMDGSNATIIGSRPGEFKADRNNIVRVWMDHGYWPLFTVNLYLNQTGDYEFLLEKNTYFKDSQICRGQERDESFPAGGKNVLLTADGTPYEGTLLEHLLIQQVTQFYDVGEHGHMRLRGADWNDALDMADQRGESVAFTAAYAGNLKTLAAVLRKLASRLDIRKIAVAEELNTLLLANQASYESPEEKQKLLLAYCRSAGKNVSGGQSLIPTEKLAKILEDMGNWIQNYIRRTEVVGDGEGHRWFNSYYDNHGRPAEGVVRNNGLTADHVRMMLTGQVFTIMSGTATDQQVEEIIQAADHYLYDSRIGGYRLNTDFHEVKLDLGRMFGFAYGHKENGAVFCHMAVMYSYALYLRGFIQEGYKVIKALYDQCMNTDISRMYPGIPEYFSEDGRGMYPYLTGAGSWVSFTVQTQMYGVRGESGDLILNPKLLLEQFDENGEARIRCFFRGRTIHLTYRNTYKREIGDYELTEAKIRLAADASPRLYTAAESNTIRIPGEIFLDCPEGTVIEVEGILE